MSININKLYFERSMQKSCFILLNPNYLYMLYVYSLYHVVPMSDVISDILP